MTQYLHLLYVLDLLRIPMDNLGHPCRWSEDRIEGSLWRAFQECHVYHGGERLACVCAVWRDGVRRHCSRPFLVWSGDVNMLASMSYTCHSLNASLNIPCPCAGMYAPNKVARQERLLLHGQVGTCLSMHVPGAAILSTSGPVPSLFEEALCKL